MNNIETLKAITRPLITGFLVIGWIAMILGQIPYPATYEGAVLGSLAWWGVDRSLMHKAERKKGSNNV